MKGATPATEPDRRRVFIACVEANTGFVEHQLAVGESGTDASGLSYTSDAGAS